MLLRQYGQRAKVLFDTCRLFAGGRILWIVHELVHNTCRPDRITFCFHRQRRACAAYPDHRAGDRWPWSDSITSEVAPNLTRLKNKGISYNHAHSVYPTVTRVNATSISTGALPSQHGIHGNSLYVPRLSPRLLNTANL